MEGLFDTLYTLCCEGNNCDLKLISEDKIEFPVHVMVVARGIPSIGHSLMGPFDRIFKRTEYHVNNVLSDELRLVIQFAYLQRCDLKEDVTDAFKLLQASVRLRMDKLQDYALEVLYRNLNIESAISFLTPAHRNNPLSSLAIQRVKVFLLRHLVYHIAEATSIPLDELRTLLRDDKLHAPREEKVAEAVLHWTRFDCVNRESSLPQLLQLVRIAFVSPTYLSNLKSLKEVSENRHAHAVLEVSHGTVRAVQENAQLVVQHLPQVLRPRLPHCTLLSIGGYEGTKLTRVVEVYDHIAERWTQVPELALNEIRGYHSLQQIGSYLYIVGGTNGPKNLNIAQRLDLRTLKWESIANMYNKRNHIATVTLKGLLYAFGGKEINERRLDSCEVYNPDTNKWKRLCPMFASRSDAAVAVSKGKMYISGGYNGRTILRECEVYDPEIDTWISLPHLIQPRTGHRMAVYRDHIFVIGGFNGHSRLSSVESFDPESQTWNIMSPMDTGRSNFGLALLYDQLIVSGGYTVDGLTDIVEIYEIMQDRWYPSPPLTVARSAHACIVIDDISFTERILSTPPRDHVSLLRDLTRERPEYLPDDATIPLPRGTAELHPVVMGPLPRPWVDLFNAEEDERLAQQQNELGDNSEESDDFEAALEDLDIFESE